MKKKRLKQAVIDGFAKFLGDVVATERDPTDVTGARRRLMERTAPSGSSEQVPADGGFLVEPTLADIVLMRGYQESVVLSRCTPWPMTANAVKIPAISEASRVDGSRWGGARGYWMNEADALTGSKPKFGITELTAKKVGVLVYLTSELLSDMGALAQYLVGDRGVMSKELAWKMTDAAINGDGAGKPQGVLNSPALISVTRAGGNAIATADVLGMLERFWVGSRIPGGAYGPNPAWFCHSDVVTTLAKLSLTVGAAGSHLPLYDPKSCTMMGYHVFPIEQCAALGTQGDIVLADMTEYILATRSQKLDVSMHVRFLNDEQAIRLIVRADGQGAWNSPVTPFTGTNTQSPFVALHA